MLDKIALREAVKGRLTVWCARTTWRATGRSSHFSPPMRSRTSPARSKDTRIDAAAITEEIKKIVFDGLYTARKYCKGANDFVFDRL